MRLACSSLPGLPFVFVHIAYQILSWRIIAKPLLQGNQA
jgi:hypothetical protein